MNVFKLLFGIISELHSCVFSLGEVLQLFLEGHDLFVDIFNLDIVNLNHVLMARFLCLPELHLHLEQSLLFLVVTNHLLESLIFLSITGMLGFKFLLELHSLLILPFFSELLHVFLHLLQFLHQWSDLTLHSRDFPLKFNELLSIGHDLIPPFNKLLVLLVMANDLLLYLLRSLPQSVALLREALPDLVFSEICQIGHGVLVLFIFGYEKFILL